MTDELVSEKRKGKPRIDMTGNRYHKLVVTRMMPDGKVWCDCDCGGDVVTLAASVRAGLTKSCGCLRLMSEGRPPKDKAKPPTILNHSSLTLAPIYGNADVGADKPVPLTTGGTFRYANPELINLLDKWLAEKGVVVEKVSDDKYRYSYNGRHYGKYTNKEQTMLGAMSDLVRREAPK